MTITIFISVEKKICERIYIHCSPVRMEANNIKWKAKGENYGLTCRKSSCGLLRRWWRNLGVHTVCMVPQGSIRSECVRDFSRSIANIPAVPFEQYILISTSSQWPHQHPTSFRSNETTNPRMTTRCRCKWKSPGFSAINGIPE